MKRQFLQAEWFELIPRIFAAGSRFCEGEDGCSIEANESNSVVVPQTASFFMLLMWWMHVSLLEDAGCS